MGPFYDLHLHSCLSPCGDAEMTPNNLVHMAALKGLQLIALTDHNSCGNCRATAQVAARCGLAFLPGMELCTAEEIHVVCIFPDCDRADAFGALVHSQLPSISNRPDIFGRQVFRDAQDREMGEEERLLLNATAIPIHQVRGLVEAQGGLCWPAHIDKEANSLLSILGTIPREYGFSRVELARPEEFLARPQGREQLSGLSWLQNSDAHYLWDISEAVHRLNPVEDRDILALAGL